MKKTLYLILFFFAAQGVVSSVAVVAFTILKRLLHLDCSMLECYQSSIGLVLIVSSIFSIVFATYLVKFRSKPVKVSTAIVATIAALPVSLFVSVLCTYFDIPDTTSQTFFDMKDNWIGVLSITIVGPIAEEYVFRRGILSTLLKTSMKPWVAIVFSSLLFGMAHLNPTQIIGASIVGGLWGWFFYRTKNILVPILAHIANNSLGVLLMYYQIPDSGEKIETKEDIYILIATLTVLFILAVVFIIWFKKTINKPCVVHPLESFSYCPKCGSTDFRVNNEKSKCCDFCGFTYYFNACAATVGVIINEKGELLVGRRAKEPAKETLDLPGGFVDNDETMEEGLLREIKEETGLSVTIERFLFSLPNVYVYSGFPVHTVDSFFLCRLSDDKQMKAMDDVAELFWIPLANLQPSDFGLDSIRKGVSQIIEDFS